MARVAVLMPVYNTPAVLLDRSIRSLFNQSFDPLIKQLHNQSNTCSTIQSIEIFCVDDGSNEATRELLDQYQKTQYEQQKYQSFNQSAEIKVVQSNQLIRFHVIHLSTNVGIACALNAGLDEIVRFERDNYSVKEILSINQSDSRTISTFDYIVRMDSDDYCEPNRIAKQVWFMNDNPTVAVSGSSVKMVTLAHAISSTDEKQSDVQLSNQSTRIIKLPQSSIMVAWSAYFYCPLAHPSVCFRRSMMCSPFDDIKQTHATSSSQSINQTIIHYPTSFSHCEDYALWLSFLERGFKLANIDLPLVTVTQPTRSNHQTITETMNGLPATDSIQQSNGLITAYMTRTNRNLQNNESLRAVHQSINRSIDQSVTLEDVQSLVHPSELRNLTRAAHAISLLTKIEQHVMSKSYDSTTSQTNEVRDDCTARIGEILALSANFPLVDESHSNNKSVNQSASQSSGSLGWNQLFQIWLRRAPPPTQMMALMALGK